MLQYDRIDASERIDINKTNESKVCMFCHYWYFKDVGYKFQPYVCNGCHAVSMMAYELKKLQYYMQKVLIIGAIYGELVKMMRLIG